MFVAKVGSALGKLDGRTADRPMVISPE